MASQNFLNIGSEIDPIETIVLHRPGNELEQLMPSYLEEMLFEDIPYVEQMQVEHDQFAQQLRDAGAEVLYFRDLLSQALDQGSKAKSWLISRVTAQLRVSSTRLQADISDFLEDQSSSSLTDFLIGGLHKSQLPVKPGARTLSSYIDRSYPFYLDPLPNMYFSRDYGTVIGQRLSVNTMKTSARKREGLLMETIARFHPRFAGHSEQLWHHHDEGDHIEGGDILVLSPSVLAIGCSARTSPDAIETLAHRLLGSDSGITKILVIQIPFARAYMHLDTVFTMVDRDAFTIFPGVADHMSLFLLSPGPNKGLTIEPKQGLKKTLAELLEIPAVRLIETGGGDLLIAEREQWNDGTNTLAIAPGKVITYRRNRVSNELLESNGIEVFDIPGSELVRGRGGPRCMSMPLARRS